MVTPRPRRKITSTLKGYGFRLCLDYCQFYWSHPTQDYSWPQMLVPRPLYTDEIQRNAPCACASNQPRRVRKRNKVVTASSTPWRSQHRTQQAFGTHVRLLHLLLWRRQRGGKHARAQRSRRRMRRAWCGSLAFDQAVLESVRRDWPQGARS